MTARPALVQAGFEGEPLDIMLGIEHGECYKSDTEGWLDAVGDWKIVDPAHPDYNPSAAAKWGPSIGPAQNRSLKYPHAWGPTDSFREVFALRDYWYNAQAAYAISKGGTDFTPWSVFRSDAYLRFKGQDFRLVTGHPDAAKWRLGVAVLPSA